MKAFDPRQWLPLSNAQKAKLLSAKAHGQLVSDNSRALARLCDMGFVTYQDGTLRLTENGNTMAAYLSK